MILNVCDFNAMEIFLLEPMGRGGKERGEGRSVGLFYCFSTLCCRSLVSIKDVIKVLDRISKSVLSRGEQKICSTFFFLSPTFSGKNNKEYIFT
jgi:hypothetical protein